GRALAGLGAGLGPGLRSVPLDSLRAVVGALLLLFGLQWLRKAILRAGGRFAQRDESIAYAQERSAAEAAPAPAGSIDWYSFALAFKSVLLEGLEVVYIVLTFGAAQHRIGLAAASAAVTMLLVAAAGAAVRGPLARVPENTLKLAVGVLLTAFGIFWSAEGLGADWPASDAALLALVAFVLVWSLALVRGLRHGARPRTAPGAVPSPEPAA